ncbi:MAG TPA: hypothetical protein VN238_19585 [Solirubrobacteraceae bacterium]|nr:hypothetical protein [Solirubrobacteraceae bacterium]
MKRRYGASPLHLILHVALFAAFAWVALQIADARAASNIVLWFLAALVLHDLVLLPFYTGIDRAAKRLTSAARVNYLRVPAALSALLLLLFFPPILGRNEGSFARVAGTPPEGYAERWLLVTAVLFGVSALIYLARAAAAARAS